MPLKASKVEKANMGGYPIKAFNGIGCVDFHWKMSPDSGIGLLASGGVAVKSRPHRSFLSNTGISPFIFSIVRVQAVTPGPGFPNVNTHRDIQVFDLSSSYKVNEYGSGRKEKHLDLEPGDVIALVNHNPGHKEGIIVPSTFGFITKSFYGPMMATVEAVRKASAPTGDGFAGEVVPPEDTLSMFLDDEPTPPTSKRPRQDVVPATQLAGSDKRSRRHVTFVDPDA
jgi:hypothetical protein